MASFSRRVDRRSGGRRLHGLALLPNGNDNDDVTGADENGGDEEERHCYQSHVNLPLPRFFEIDPALRSVMRRFLQGKQE